MRPAPIRLGYITQLALYWHRATDLNRKPLILEITALPIELARYIVDRQTRLERAFASITFLLVRSQGGY